MHYRYNTLKRAIEEITDEEYEQKKHHLDTSAMYGGIPTICDTPQLALENAIRILNDQRQAALDKMNEAIGQLTNWTRIYNECVQVALTFSHPKQ